MGRLLSSTEKSDQRYLFALEYFYRAWPMDDAARFPVFFMALDGVCGDANQATKTVIDRVCRIIGPRVDRSRIGALMDIRASVIHGGAPDVLDSRKYAHYYAKYYADPIGDLELVIAECLRTVIFGDAIGLYQDLYAEEKTAARAKGVVMSDPYQFAVLRPEISTKLTR